MKDNIRTMRAMFFLSSTAQMVYSRIIQEFDMLGLAWYKTDDDDYSDDPDRPIDIPPWTRTFIVEAIQSLMITGYCVWSAERSGKGDDKDVRVPFVTDCKDFIVMENSKTGSVSYVVVPVYDDVHDKIARGASTAGNIKFQTVGVPNIAGELIGGKKVLWYTNVKKWNIQMLYRPIGNYRVQSAISRAFYLLNEIEDTKRRFHERDWHNSAPGIITRINDQRHHGEGTNSNWFHTLQTVSGGINPLNAMDNEAGEDLNLENRNRIAIKMAHATEMTQAKHEITESEERDVKKREMAEVDPEYDLDPCRFSGFGFVRRSTGKRHVEHMVSDGRTGEKTSQLLSPDSYHMLRHNEVRACTVMGAPVQVMGLSADAERKQEGGMAAASGHSVFRSTIIMYMNVLEDILRECATKRTKGGVYRLKFHPPVSEHILERTESILTADACQYMYSKVYNIPVSLISKKRIRERQDSLLYGGGTGDNREAKRLRNDHERAERAHDRGDRLASGGPDAADHGGASQ